MVNENKRIALVTGANRGIGFEVVRQLASTKMKVYLGSRIREKGIEGERLLRAEGLDVTTIELDTRSETTVERAVETLSKSHGALDILVNNAGANYDYGVTPLKTDFKFLRDTLENNLIGTWLVIQKFLPLLQKSSSARIVNVASGAGSFADPGFGLSTMGGGVASYGISKLALNGLTVKLATELSGTKILVNSVCPGFTATQPGLEAMGARPVKQGAASVVWTALIPDGGPSGKFFRDGKEIGW